MLPGFVAVFMITSFVSLYLIFPMLGLTEGDTFAHSVAGWIAAVIGWAAPEAERGVHTARSWYHADSDEE
jgi:hypothetical protein